MRPLLFFLFFCVEIFKKNIIIKNEEGKMKGNTIMISFTRPEEIIYNEPYSMLIYGEAGIGKTTTALSATNACLLDFEGGMRRVQADFWIPSLNVAKYEDAVEIINGNATDEFDTIVIDPLSAVLDSITEHLFVKCPKLKMGNSLSIKGYGELKAEFINFYKAIKAKKKNIIFVAHEKTETDGDNSIIKPDTGVGKGGLELIKFLDIIGYIKHLNGKRAIYFDSDNGEFVAKNSLRLPKCTVIEDPSNTGANNFIARNIEKTIEQKQSMMHERAEMLANELAKHTEEISNIQDLDMCNAVYKEISSITINSIKLICKQKLLEKTKELNFIWSTENKKFETAKVEA